MVDGQQVMLNSATFGLVKFNFGCICREFY